ncbi:MAG: polysaccharide deacetylase, partial [Planctomycetes bacterium]|nr:polysaccharide deacetylase [Planctomycetota bacterium]
MSRAVAEAAHEGKMGLRVVDEDARDGSSALSAKLPVKPGQAITLAFWAKANADFLGVYLWFFNSGGKLISDPNQKAGAGHPLCGVKKA